MIEVFFWWLMLGITGIAFLPLGNLIFRRFRDRGWIFTKLIGLFLAVWVTWTLNVLHVIPFRRPYILAVLLVLALVNFVLYYLGVHRGVFSREDENGIRPKVNPEYEITVFSDLDARRLILIEDLLFLAMMLIWMWIIGFRPQAYGTEKFMDYAFLTSLARSDYMPFADPWYAGEAVNYYYGGQFVAAWLMKAVGTSTGVAYNAMRALVTAASFILPFSLAYQLMYDRVSATTAKRFGKMLAFAGGSSLTDTATIPAMLQDDTGAVLSSARNAHRMQWRKGRKAVREEAKAKAQQFLADAEENELAELEKFVEETARLEEEAAEKREAAAEGRAKKSRKETEKSRSRAAAKRADVRNAERSSSAKDPAFWPSLFCGLLAGIGVAFGATFHYVIFGLIKPIQAAMAGESYTYWFPDSTRYIGYNPDLPDKTIHEYPSYSSVLGDLHAHYINILFVVTVVAIVYAWAQKQEEGKTGRLPFLKPEILLIGLMTGVFRWTNFWDFPIYYVVCGSILFFVNLRTYRGQLFKFIGVMVLEAALMFGIGMAAALPFTMNFRMISSEVALTHSHTLLYQLLILWGLPVTILVVFIITLILEQKSMRAKTRKSLWNANRITLPDLAVLLFGLCASGLVLMPEVIYVKDIYTESHYRANTMFKLSYQAFILFGIVMAYVLVRALVTNKREVFEAEFRAESEADVGLASVLDAADLAAKAVLSKTETAEKKDDPEQLTEQLPDSEEEEAFRELQLSVEERTKSSAFSKVNEMHHRKNRWRRVRIAVACAGIFCMLLTAGYTLTSIKSWFGNVWNASARISDDATVYMEQTFPDDVKAVNWLINNVEGQPTILEAPGKSYSKYGRVSVTTGLPTVAGWYVHEWLWRENVAELNERNSDIEKIYTSDNAEEVKALIAKYNIRYVYIGTLEREKYGFIQDVLLQSLGTVAYSDGVTTYIMDMQQ
ncbi:MAG: DUF2298 domain-containing protein [Lachnospiraceae bacterium]|nr:DUF2298 domain-containing protein [Lachnospiraceae bacterium]